MSKMYFIGAIFVGIGGRLFPISFWLAIFCTIYGYSCMLVAEYYRWRDERKNKKARKNKIKRSLCCHNNYNFVKKIDSESS